MISSNISSMTSHQTWMNSIAHNVANVNSSDFTPQGTTIQARTNDSVVANTSLASNNQTDLANEMTNQINIERSMEANAASIKTEDQMLGTLLDIKA